MLEDTYVQTSRASWGSCGTRPAKPASCRRRENPSGHACPNLPKLLAGNWKHMAVPNNVLVASKMQEVVVTDLPLDFADVSSPHELLVKQQAHAETLEHEPVLAPTYQWALA